MEKISKKSVKAFCTCLPSGNQVDGLLLALVYQKMYADDENCNVKLSANRQDIDSLYIEASNGAIQYQKW